MAVDEPMAANGTRVNASGIITVPNKAAFVFPMDLTPQ
jgi:hypothetical protein